MSIAGTKLFSGGVYLSVEGQMGGLTVRLARRWLRKIFPSATQTGVTGSSSAVLFKFCKAPVLYMAIEKLKIEPFVDERNKGVEITFSLNRKFQFQCPRQAPVMLDVHTDSQINHFLIYALIDHITDKAERLVGVTIEGGISEVSPSSNSFPNELKVAIRMYPYRAD